MTPAGDTGLPQQDAQSDFASPGAAARFEDRLAPAARARRRVDDAARSRRSSRRWAAAASATSACRDPAGLDRRHRRPRRGEFDRNFRPPRPACAGAGSGSPTARRRGQTMPPIDVYRIGELHFVQDGHHRVSVARALGDTHIEAHVREVRTAARRRAASCGCATCRSSTTSACSTSACRCRPSCAPGSSCQTSGATPSSATLVEAWGLRASHARGQLLSREEIARAWFHEEYEPVVEALSRGQHRRRGHRDRALHADRDAPLPAADHARGHRRDPRSAARRARSPRRPAKTRWSTRSSRRWTERRGAVVWRRPGGGAGSRPTPHRFATARGSSLRGTGFTQSRTRARSVKAVPVFRT